MRRFMLLFSVLLGLCAGSEAMIYDQEIKALKRRVAELETAAAELVGAVDVTKAPYNATGDGSTDDTAAFVAAAATGLEIWVPPPEDCFKITSTITISNTIRGFGMPEICMSGSDGSATYVMVKVADYQGEGLVIEGLHLDGGWTGGTNSEFAHNVSIRGSSNVTVRDNYLERAYGDNVSLLSQGSDGSYVMCDNIRIYDNSLIDPRRCNVAIVGAMNVYIDRNTMDHDVSYVAPIDIEGNNDTEFTLDDIYIRHNRFDSATQSVINFFNTTSGHVYNRFYIEDNEVTLANGANQYFIRIAADQSGTIDHLYVSRNKAKGDGRFILAPEGRVTNLVLQDNVDMLTETSGWLIDEIVAPVVDGNVISTTTDRWIGMLFDECDQAVITNNVIKGPNKAGFGPLTIQATDAPDEAQYYVIRSNVITNTAGYGIYAKDEPFLRSIIAENTIHAANPVYLDTGTEDSDLKILPNNHHTHNVVVVGFDHMKKLYSGENVAGSGTNGTDGLKFSWWNDAEPSSEPVTASDGWAGGDVGWNYSPERGDPVLWSLSTDGYWEPVYSTLGTPSAGSVIKYSSGSFGEWSSVSITDTVKGGDVTGTNVFSANANTLGANTGFMKIKNLAGSEVWVPYWTSVTP